jgi:3-keto-5-aminohexanoate cleavage enzyme
VNGRSSQMDKLIITVAPTGSVPSREMSAYLPVTPEEIAETALLCRRAGASLIHIHARDAAGKPTLDPDVFARIHDLITERSDLVVQLSTAWNRKHERRRYVSSVRRWPR